jgi:hypothetical protein
MTHVDAIEPSVEHEFMRHFFDFLGDHGLAIGVYPKRGIHGRVDQLLFLRFDNET